MLFPERKNVTYLIPLSLLQPLSPSRITLSTHHRPTIPGRAPRPEQTSHTRNTRELVYAVNQHARAGSAVREPKLLVSPVVFAKLDAPASPSVRTASAPHILDAERATTTL